MPKKPSTIKSENATIYLQRGNQRIELEKEDDRFTIMPLNQGQIKLARSLPEVRKIVRVTNHVYKVETTPSERDSVMAKLRSRVHKTIVHHAYRPKDSKGTIYYITDKIIVRFGKRATTAQIDELLKRYGLDIIRQYENQEDKKTYLLRVTSASKENPIKLANHLMKEKIIIFAEPSLVNRFRRAFIPPDTLFPRQWHLNSKKGPQLLQNASIKAPKAWDTTRGSREIVVAIIDDGFDLTHPDFQGFGKVVFPKDYVDKDSFPFPVKEHGDIHGTPAAGVAIAESNGTGVVGVAPGCAFMPVRFPVKAPDDVLIHIFEQVAKKADVISCSWGPPPVFSPLHSKLDETIRTLATNGGPRNKGCVICVAAGNCNSPLNSYNVKPKSINADGFTWLDDDGHLTQTRGLILNGLACHPNVIAVAASTSLNKHAAYSNWGNEISICAPSDNFNPLDLHRLPGLGIWTTNNKPFGLGITPGSRYTGKFGGTSSATPLVAGVAALVLSANQNLSAADVKKILQDTADKIVDNDPDIILEKNRGKYSRNGRCEWFGFGKVNAARAVQAAKLR